MTKEELINILQSVRAYAVIAQSKLKVRDAMRSELNTLKSCLNTDGLPRSPQSVDATEKYDNLLQDINNFLPVIAASISNSVKHKMLVLDYIDMLKDKPVLEAVLRLRYVESLAMEEVSRKLQRTVPGEMNYSKRQCWRYHNDAIDELLKILNDGTVWHAEIC